MKGQNNELFKEILLSGTIENQEHKSEKRDRKWTESMLFGKKYWEM